MDIVKVLQKQQTTLMEISKQLKFLSEAQEECVNNLQTISDDYRRRADADDLAIDRIKERK